MKLSTLAASQSVNETTVHCRFVMSPLGETDNNPAVATSENTINVSRPGDWVTNGIYYWSGVNMYNDVNISIDLACNAPESNMWDITAVISLTNKQNCDVNITWDCTYPPGQTTFLTPPPSPLPANSTLSHTIQLSNFGKQLSITYQYMLNANNKNVPAPPYITIYTGFPYNGGGSGGGGNE